MYKKQNLLDFKLPDRIAVSPLKTQSPSVSPPRVIPATIAPSIITTPASNKTISTPQGPSNQVVFLKKKLLQTHNKLLEQLQSGKKYQHEMVIMTQQLEKYKQKVRLLEANLQNGISNISNNYNVSIAHHNQQIEEYKRRLNQQNIIKSKISEQNVKVSLEVRNLKNHLRQIQAELQIKDDQNRKLVDKVNVLKKNLQSLKYEHENQITNLRGKAQDSKKLMVQEVKETQSEKKSLTRKIQTLQQQVYSLQDQNKILRAELDDQQKNRSYSSGKNKIIDELKYEMNRAKAILHEKQHQIQQLKIRLKMKPQKKTFDDTKNLIQRLQHVEHLTRSRGLSKGVSQSTLGRSIRTKTQSESELKRQKSKGRFDRKLFSDD